MKTQALENTKEQHGVLQNVQTWLNTTVKRAWRYKHGLELQFESETVNSWTLKGTPYNIVHEQGEYFSVIGQNRVSDTFNNIKECIKDAKRIDHQKIMQLSIMICEEYGKRQSQKEAINKKQTK